MTRGYDHGLRAPKTGRIVPVAPQLWQVECYTCKAATPVTTRALAIRAHLEHVRDVHKAA